MTYRNVTRLAAAVALIHAAGALTACKAPQAFGERHDLVIRADSTLWTQIDSAVLATLERRVYTTRPERTFEVIYVAPEDTLWEDFRLFWQVLVIGTPQDELAADLAEGSSEPGVEPPALVQLENRWARGQLVTVLLLPEQGTAEAARQILPDVYEQLSSEYTEWATARMYSSGINDSLVAVLEQHGFTLAVPRVYEFMREDSLFRFRNSHLMGDTELIRSLLVTWESGIDSLRPDSLFAWRQQLGQNYYEPAQLVLQEGFRWDTIQVAGREALELRGVFQDETEFPAAGPFITRQIPCPDQDRTYYMDAWLYAPSNDKYPYVRQLEILMQSFRCTGAAMADNTGAGGTEG